MHTSNKAREKSPYKGQNAPGNQFRDAKTEPTKTPAHKQSAKYHLIIRIEILLIVSSTSERDAAVSVSLSLSPARTSGFVIGTETK